MSRRLATIEGRSRLALCALGVLCGSVLLGAQSKTRAHVETLASPRLEGRLAGSNGEKLASDYIVAELQKIGAKPLPGRSDLLMPFEFTAGTKDGGSRISVSRTTRDASSGTVGGIAGGLMPDNPAVRALSFSDNGDADAPVVFAGY